MSRNAQRLSQLVSTFGPGAMVDLPKRSVVISGLDHWAMGGEGAFQIIAEPRLSERLERLLKQQGRLAEDKKLSLRTPPLDGADGNGARFVKSPVFPKWFVCEKAEPGAEGTGTFRRRRLAPWDELDSKRRQVYHFEDGSKSEVTPIRFVCACDDGHLQDIDWRYIVHPGESCAEPMWLEETGTSADPSDTVVRCGCGRRLALHHAFAPGRLGKCRGQRPWLLDREPDGCDKNLKLLTRTATNTYFPQVLTVISLPAEEDELSQLVAEMSGRLASVATVEDVALAKRFVDEVRATLGRFEDSEIFDRLTRLRDGAGAVTTRNPRVAEFDLFASGRDLIGRNDPDARLHAETLKREVWADESAGVDLSPIRNLVTVHRLREVSCLYGFTRFEPAPTETDGDLEEMSLAVRGAPIAADADWLPAVEQFGEGLFVHFDHRAIGEWIERDGAKARGLALKRGYDAWAQRFAAKARPRYPGTPYVLLHSLSHALMAEIALECGYPMSSLKERIYAIADESGTVSRCGILIYTASAGAQGTLGGLVATAPRFAILLRRALDRARICSNDPVCADHEPDRRTADRATHGAACHGCLLIAETSCESRNLLLDRNLLVPTMSSEEGLTAFFSVDDENAFF